MMQEPIRNRTFNKLRTVVSTEWEHPQYHGVLEFRGLLVEQCFPDLVAEVSRRLKDEPDTTILKLWKVCMRKVCECRART